MHLFLKFYAAYTRISLKVSKSIALQKNTAKRTWIIFIIDFIILSTSYLLMVWIKPVSREYFTAKYFIGLGILITAWIACSFIFHKYRITRNETLYDILKQIITANFITLAIISIFIVALQAESFSRLIIFGTIFIASMIEIVLANIDYFLIHTLENQTDITNPPPRALEIRKAKLAVNYNEISINSDSVREGIIEECGEEAFDFISGFADFTEPEVLFISTTTRFNIQLQPDQYFRKIINLKRTNDIQYINKFFEAINRKLPCGGIFIGCVETNELRKKRILTKYPPVIRWIMFVIDYIINRVFPKFLLTKKLYFLFTSGENRVISRAEILGRLYSCGFEILSEQYIGTLFYFVVHKVKEPAYDMNPSYGPFVKLKRIGKNGKIIKVYKLRTMHPYAEYLQDYMYKVHKLKKGGKFRDDFRISRAGRIFRTFWLDEVPMFINLFRGDMKFFGVRPLSPQYFQLYNQELREKRIKYKPGLIPPYYADLPRTLEEIQNSELKYLEAYERHPVKTDIIYFWKALRNILFHRVRSG
jgi:hypothetical protein